MDECSAFDARCEETVASCVETGMQTSNVITAFICMCGITVTGS